LSTIFGLTFIIKAAKMEFNEYWEENKVKAGLLLRKKCDVEAGWYAHLEYGAPNSIDNKSSFQFPKLVDVLKMFKGWAKKKQDRDGNIGTLELVEAIYDFVVGNKKH